jgi:trehalose utilization protein
MEQIFVKPAVDGAVIRHPEKVSHVLNSQGEWVVNSIQWQRYIKHGDVVVANPPQEQVSEKSSKSTKAGAQ